MVVRTPRWRAGWWACLSISRAIRIISEDLREQLDSEVDIGSHGVLGNAEMIGGPGGAHPWSSARRVWWPGAEAIEHDALSAAVAIHVRNASSQAPKIHAPNRGTLGIALVAASSSGLRCDTLMMLAQL